MPEHGLDVLACVELVRQGDEDAARALMNHLYPLVVKIVRAHLPRRTSEEDMVQSVFIKVFTRLEQFSGGVPLEHWISRIAVNTCLDQISKERIRPEVRWADLNEHEQHLVETLLSSAAELPHSEAVASRELVSKLLQQLGPEDRLVLTLIHLDGCSIEEVREITGWNASLIKIRAFRARRKLRRGFEKLMKTHS